LSFVVLGLISGMFAMTIPSATGVTNSCRARNITQATAVGSDLQAVIDAANAGDRIAVRGRCVGNFQVSRRGGLTLVGKATSRLPRPILDGNQTGGTLLVSARLKLVNLVITRGLANGATSDAGGGIFNNGWLTLKDSVVRGNTARIGGGILNNNTLKLIGSSSVFRNSAQTVDATDSGGGIHNDGTVTLSDLASVSGNTSDGHGGGVANHKNNVHTSVVILQGSATVTGNVARVGGGVYNQDSVTLDGSATVMGNSALGNGGGIFNDGNGTATLNDSSTVTQNTANANGGGIFNDGTVTMNASASVTANTADADDDDDGVGGGIFECGTLNNAIDGVNVDGNYRRTDSARVEDNITHC